MRNIATATSAQVNELVEEFGQEFTLVSCISGTITSGVCCG